jgi:hypothetical protein
MASLALSVASVVIGYLVLRYRVHVVVVVQPRPAKAGARTLSRSNPAQQPRDLWQREHAPDIAAALVNLGAPKDKARVIAARVCASGTNDFNSLLRAAIQEAAA